jgi:alpha-ketoglutaric semialdehyde dehydrogenase
MTQTHIGKDSKSVKIIKKREVKVETRQFIGGRTDNSYYQEDKSFYARNPATAESLDPQFFEVSSLGIQAACDCAAAAFEGFSSLKGATKANFLDAIASQIEALGDELVSRAMLETALPQARIQGERGRTCGQLRMFATLLREGSWVDARIDTKQKDRLPLAKPDLRSIKQALGPVAVFGASNFPLAFSVAGGDTASALAAGCPVIVKAHPAHPGTSQLVAEAICRAAEQTSMPAGVFSLLQGSRHETGGELVKHDAVAAVAFTGSLQAGRALYDLASSREVPIPVFAEMGSSNPVFFLPEIVSAECQGLAESAAQSVLMGVGQFCTNPGIMVMIDSQQSRDFAQHLSAKLDGVDAGVMLTAGIQQSYDDAVATRAAKKSVQALNQKPNKQRACASLQTVTAVDFIAQTELADEIFGPASLLVYCQDFDEMLALANSLEGQLTCSLWGTERELIEQAALVSVLVKTAGRVVFNGFPTGVEVAHAMVHGGPYPATTANGSTSVGTAAVDRFSRSVCFQDCPDELLPDGLKDSNPENIWRLVNGKRSQCGLKEGS